MYGITFSPGASQYRQLVEQLRKHIASGSMPSGTRLASTRDLAQTLGLSRGIVLEAIDQLKLEGYLETIQGSGTFIRHGVIWQPGGSEALGTEDEAPSDPLVSHQANSQGLLSFVPGLPDLALFPRRQWLSCYHDAVEYASPENLGYGDPSGDRALREAIAGYLREFKGIQAGPEQIVVTAGASQAFAILAELCPRTRIVVEDPQAPFIRRIFEGLGCTLLYTPVDEEGLLDTAIPSGPVDFIYVTPSHQFPVGGCLSAARRVALLGKARSIGAWVIEDDFDSEFRYDGHPVAPLQVMDPGRVVYVGSFSKTLSPALRLGFMVLPRGLQARVKTLKRRWDLRLEGLQQKALALFISRGHLSRHVARCHRLFRQKNMLLRRLVAAKLSDSWKISGESTGMHVILRRVGAEEDNANILLMVKELRVREIQVEPVTAYCRENTAFRDAILVAYAHRTQAEIEQFVEALAEISAAKKA